MKVTVSSSDACKQLYGECHFFPWQRDMEFAFSPIYIWFVFDIICKQLLQLVAEVSMYVLQWLVSIILNFDNLFLHRVEYDLRNRQV